MTKQEIYTKHLEAFYIKNPNATFSDVPRSVFFDMMEEYANERLKNNSRLDNVSENPRQKPNKTVTPIPECPVCENPHPHLHKGGVIICDECGNEW